MGSKHKIMQWNCRGLGPRYEELILLLTLLGPSVFCLRETCLKAGGTFTFKGFDACSRIHSGCLRASGGGSVFVRSSCPQREIELGAGLQAVAVSVALERDIALCSVCVPPSFALGSDHLISLLGQLPSRFFLLGDFGGHNVLWGSKDSDPGGEVIGDFVTGGDICLMNDGSHTCLDSGKGALSSIDLSLCHPSIFLDCDWSVCEDQHGSDHFPIIIESLQHSSGGRSPRWKLGGADWGLFRSLCEESLAAVSLSGSVGPIAGFASSLVDVCGGCVPGTSTGPGKGNPWCNQDCGEAVKEGKQALSKFCKCPTRGNLGSVGLFGAGARRTVESAGRESWRTCVSKLNCGTPIEKVWDMVRGVSGKSESAGYKRLNANFGGTETRAASKGDVADTLGSTFVKDSSSRNCCEGFRTYMCDQQGFGLDFGSSGAGECGGPFNLVELGEAVDGSHGTAAGPDGVRCRVLGHLPPRSLQALLDVFDDIWEAGTFPGGWELSAVMPVPGPGEGHTEPAGCRPMALAGCLCEALGRVISTRLIWYLESNNLVSPVQSGFRSGRGAGDSLIGLETFIRDAFVGRERVVAVFFDLERACDAAWRCGVLRGLHELGLGGGLPVFIGGFLADRRVRVRVGSALSGRFGRARGVPRGAILSATLFDVGVDSIVGCLGPRTEGSLCVGGFCVCCGSKGVRTVGRRLQRCLDEIENWALFGGFGFSKSKARCVHFCRLGGLRDGPRLCLCGSLVPVVDGAGFLGVIFDRGLSFVPRVGCLKAGCLKALGLLRVLSRAGWGAGRSVLLRLCRSLVRSGLDCGAIVCGSARGSCLAVLDAVHRLGLRLALGAFRASPVGGLCVEAGGPSLCLRGEGLALQCAIGLAAGPSGPACRVAFPPYISEDIVSLCGGGPNVVKPFGLGIRPLLASAGINPGAVEEGSVPEVPSWCVGGPSIVFSLHSGRRSEADPDLLGRDFRGLRLYYAGCRRVCAGGSGGGGGVGCAVLGESGRRAVRIPDGSSIFTAEAGAIDLALDLVDNCGSCDGFIIFSDSFSVLQALNHTSSRNPQIQNILQKHHTISKYKTVVCCWIPGHIGVRSGERVDEGAKESLNLEQTVFKIPCNNFGPFINRCMFDKWQTSWNETPFNKLKEIKPVIKESKTVISNIRREEVVLTRLRIGHTRITHSWLLNRDEQPICTGCDVPFTVKHFLLECFDFQQTRRSYFQVNNLHDLFKDVPIENIIAFLKEIKLFNKI